MEPLIPLLRSKQEYARDEKTRWIAERLFYESARPEHVSLLIALLSDEHPFVRAAAAQALGKVRAPEALAPLQALRTDESPVHEDLPRGGGPPVREFVELALSKLLEPPAEKSLTHS